ncbi:MAG: hypothetical protein HRT44_12680, partial [Bdellovibrionales bacterium]|nr:hypothetical protein [Bdellovibrionales bacterium]NQZ20092.1 hypothetical protein [Bdellovibrionales bacterium]
MKSILVAALLVLVATPSFANRSRGTDPAREMTRLETRAEVVERVNRVNEVLSSKGLTEIVIRDVEIGTAELARLNETLDSFYRDINDVTKIEQIEVLRSNNLTATVNRALQGTGNIVRGARESQASEAQILPEVAANVIRIMQEVMNKDSNSDAIKLAL